MKETLSPSWIKKVELPTFEGQDPVVWLARAENFQGTSKSLERLKLALLAWRGMSCPGFNISTRKPRIILGRGSQEL